MLVNPWFRQLDTKKSLKQYEIDYVLKASDLFKHLPPEMPPPHEYIDKSYHLCHTIWGFGNSIKFKLAKMESSVVCCCCGEKLGYYDVFYQLRIDKDRFIKSVKNGQL